MKKFLLILSFLFMSCSTSFYVYEVNKDKQGFYRYVFVTEDYSKVETLKTDSLYFKKGTVVKIKDIKNTPDYRPRY